MGLGLSGWFGAPALGAEPALSTSHRGQRHTGAYLTLMGDPYPTLAGLNVAINLFDFLRLTAGAGGVGEGFGSLGGARGVASATSVGGGVRLLVPGWSFSPIVGFSYARIQISRHAPGPIDIQGFRESGEHWYATVGLDYQAADGFNLGAGCSVSTNVAIGPLPYINMGWFFPFI